MALTGVHVECGTSIVRGTSTIFSRIWSETIAYGGTTTQSAPKGYSQPGNLVFRIRNAAVGEAWVSTGITPDTSQAISSTDDNERAHFSASELRDIEAKIGWKVQASAVA